MPLPSQCPLCQGDAEKQNVVTRHVFGGKPQHAFYCCDDCTVNYLYPGLTSDEESKFYTEEFSKFMTSRAGVQAGWEEPEKHVVSNEWMRKRRMKYLRSYLPRSGKILEIGCSSAFMLYPLVEESYECVGVEPSGVFGKFVRSKGLDCYDKFEDLLTSPKHKGGFDVIMHAYVMEHVSDPSRFLKEQLDILKPGGSLVFEIPNAADALLTIYDIPEFERFYWHVGHYWYFTKKSLEYLLNEIGLPYEIVLDERYDLSNHMVWARDGKPGGMARFTEKFGEDLEDQYRQALIKSGYCDTLIGVIQKLAQ